MNRSPKTLLISGGFALRVCIFLVQSVMLYLFNFYGSAFFSMLALLSLAASVAILAGFALWYFEDRDIFSLLILASLGFSILLSLLNILGLYHLYSFLPAIILNSITASYLVFWAIKVKDNNIIFSAALGALFLWSLLLGRVVSNLHGLLYTLIQTVIMAVPVAVAWLSGEE